MSNSLASRLGSVGSSSSNVTSFSWVICVLMTLNYISFNLHYATSWWEWQSVPQVLWYLARGWLLRQFITSIIGTLQVHRPAAFSGGHHCQGRRPGPWKAWNFARNQLVVCAKQDNSPTSLWLYATDVHYRPKCPKINRKNPNAVAQRSLSVSF